MQIQSLMSSHLIFLSTAFFSKTQLDLQQLKNYKYPRGGKRQTSRGFPVRRRETRINVMYTHVLRGCGKVLADQLNFHDGGDTRHYGATYHDKRGRDGLGRLLRAILNYR